MTAFLLILVIIYCIYLTKKIGDLEKKIQTSSGLAQAVSYPTETATTTVAQTSQLSHQEFDQSATPQQPPSLNQTTTNSSSGLITWLSTDWLLKLGALLLILGIAWFVSYAFAENWIGPVGRISLGYLIGIVILLFGSWWNKKNSLQATIFMVVGLTAILITTYFARAAYNFFDPFTATLLMGAAIAYAAFSSVIQKIESRAIVSLAMAAIVPFLTVSDTASVIGFLSYGFVICAASLWIVSLTGWRRISATAMGIYAIYALLSMFAMTSDDIFLFRVFALSFTSLFYLVGLITHFKVKVPSWPDYFVTLGNALIMVVWIDRLETDLASLITTAAALAFFTGAYLLFQAARKPMVILEYTTVALALLAIAATFEFSGPVLTISYSLLSCVGVFLTLAITNKIDHAQKVGLLLIPVFVHSLFQWLESRSRALYAINAVKGTVSNEYLISWWALAIELLGLGYFFYKKGQQQNDKQIKNNAAVFLIGSLFLTLLSIWYSVSVLIEKVDTSRAVTLVIFTLTGLALYLYGRLSFHKKTMYAGASVLGFVVLRLLLFEVWSMVLFQRVIVFTLIGILLMSTAFVKPPAQKESQ